MKKLLAAGLLLLFMGSFAFTQPEDFNPGTEPDGFRGLKWGTPLSALTDMHQVWDGGDNKYYERKDDPLEISGARLHRIVYTFWRGQFSEVKLEVMKDYGNPQDEFTYFKVLRQACFDRFGARRKGIWGSEEYSWFGHTSRVKLVREGPASLQLTMGSARLLEQKRLFEEKKALREKDSRQQLAKDGIGF